MIMQQDIENTKRDLFRNILMNLAQKPELISNPTNRLKIYEQLEDLYYDSIAQNCFRHFYSDIFSILTIINNPSYNIAINDFGENISVLRKEYQPTRYDCNNNLIDITQNLKKLDDHISLEVARINYVDKFDRLDRIEKQEEKIIEQSNNVKILEDNINSIQKDHVTILGIFAAVVLAFTGGIVYSTSVLSNIHLVSTYKTIAVVLIIGLVLVNILFSLFYYIDGIVKKNTEPKLAPFYIANAILLSLLFLIFFAWTAGFIEKRNEHFNNHLEEQPTITYQIE